MTGNPAPRNHEPVQRPHHHNSAASRGRGGTESPGLRARPLRPEPTAGWKTGRLGHPLASSRGHSHGAVAPSRSPGALGGGSTGTRLPQPGASALLSAHYQESRGRRTTRSARSQQAALDFGPYLYPLSVPYER
jgi:hypothetical protein